VIISYDTEPDEQENRIHKDVVKGSWGSWPRPTRASDGFQQPVIVWIALSLI
jgi:hypothetical protein